LGTIVYAAHGSRAFGKERVEVFGGGKAASLDDFRRLELVTDSKRKATTHRWRTDKGHAGLWEAFLRSIESGGGPPLPYRDLFGVAETTLAAVDSLRTGAAVDLDFSAYETGDGGMERPGPAVWAG
jgi:predicted dehydrogenase